MLVRAWLFTRALCALQLLVDTFRSLSERDTHLSNFHIIIPSLCLSFTESIKNAKDTLWKSVKVCVSVFVDRFYRGPWSAHHCVMFAGP